MEKQKSWLGKKAQAGSEGAVLLARTVFYSIFTFGILQLIAFLIPGFGKLIIQFSDWAFGGKRIILLFLAGGLIGFAINEAALLLQIRQVPFSKRMFAALVGAVGIVVVSIIIPIIAPATVTQSLLLP